MDGRPSNDALLRELREGTAHFELLQPPAPFPLASASSSRSLFFARIGSPMSPAMKKLEHYTVERVTGDGRCMFRALVKGMARNKGLKLSPQQEKDDSGPLPLAGFQGYWVLDCIQISLMNYGWLSKRLYATVKVNDFNTANALKDLIFGVESQSYWSYQGYVNSQSLYIYQSMSELKLVTHAMGSRGTGFIPIAEYGSEFRKASKGKPRTTVRLLYSGKNHYDLLV
ncbi:hypothetical protein Taro_025542 [Colocasia esculenta]|uniref:OTU domain-containing protein n=1 Tax=Colocasia esculenta TaxID=4460 RepID=A0A843V9M9_COLES|nr:hypothetical protein [Colocasia esculenta]